MDDAQQRNAKDAQEDAQEVLGVIETCGLIRAGEIAQKVPWARDGSDRRLDAALQRLRRAGKIRYASPAGWSVTTTVGPR